MNVDFSNNAFFDITQGTTGTILDTNGAASPNIIFKNEQELGITASGTDISSNITNLQTYQKYYDTLFSNVDDSILNNPANNKNRRYFSSTGTKCIDEKTEKLVEQYYVVDGMAKTPEYDSKGLALSAYALLDYIDSSNNLNYYSVDENNNNNINISSLANKDDVLCKNVKMDTSPSGDSTTGYISKSDFKTWSDRGVVSEAFHDNSRHSHIVHGWQPKWEDIGGDSGYGYLIYDTVSYVVPETINIIKTPELETPSYAVISTDKIYKRTQRDIITGVFIGSCTIVGLYVVFRMLNLKS